MYATCLFCSGNLGRNEALEHFPVGRRLAFDAARGRLWVICRHCARWNLTPLEARWEAIEEAERLYRDTRLRASTDNVGLAKVRDGTELVRIGRPQLPEFAGWRYGDVFKRRRRKTLLMSGAITTGTVVYVGVQFAGLMGLGAATTGVVAGMSLLNAIQGMGSLYTTRRVRAMVVDKDGRRLRVTGQQAAVSNIVSGPQEEGGWSLQVTYRPQAGRSRLWQSISTGTIDEYDPGHTLLKGEFAHRALAKLLPIVNREGASAAVVREAVNVVSAPRDPLGALDGRTIARGTLHLQPGLNSLCGVNPALRLALEMSMHEADERRALEGELRELEERWREAEEIASIADSMFTPAQLTARLADLRERRD